MHLVLCDPDPGVGEAWATWFTGTDVTIRVCGFADLAEPVDCLVTAGNSFGLMDGGVDLVVRDLYPGSGPATGSCAPTRPPGRWHVPGGTGTPRPNGSPGSMRASARDSSRTGAPGLRPTTS